MNHPPCIPAHVVLIPGEPVTPSEVYDVLGEVASVFGSVASVVVAYEDDYTAPAARIWTAGRGVPFALGAADVDEVFAQADLIVFFDEGLPVAKAVRVVFWGPQQVSPRLHRLEALS